MSDDSNSQNPIQDLIQLIITLIIFSLIIYGLYRLVKFITISTYKGIKYLVMKYQERNSNRILTK